MQNFDPLGLVSLAVASGATTPVPAEGIALVYSTTLGSLAFWNGSVWSSVSASGSSSTSVMTGATGSTGTDLPGASGLVPAPTAGQQNLALLGNGSWRAVITPYVQANAYEIGDQAYWNGIRVTPNAAIPAGTAFAWGTTGATWSPADYISSWQGVYSGTTTYGLGAVVVSSTTATTLFLSQYASNLGNALASNVWADLLGNASPYPVMTQVSLTFGVGGAPVQAQVFTITTPCVVGQKVMMTATADLPSGGITQTDELDFDNFMCAATVSANGTVTAYITAFPGPVMGTYAFNLLII